MLYQGEDIKKLIPQRDPIMMVDKFFSVEGDTAKTGLLFSADNFFLEEDGKMAEVGLIEHIAQSASAFAGHKALVQGQPLPVGYIGEVKKFHCYERPVVGSEIQTFITMGTEVNGVTLLTGKVEVNGVVVADTQMKIFVE